MQCNCCKNLNTIERVEHLLGAIKTIDLDQLEKIVQAAHECDIHQIDTPAEPLPISRQALRMFWHFRHKIDAIEIHTEVGT